MDSKHTSGPWTLAPGTGYPFNVECPTDIDGIPGRVATFGYRPNADRAVACVNALEGVADPEAFMRAIAALLPEVVTQLRLTAGAIVDGGDNLDDEAHDLYVTADRAEVVARMVQR